MYIYAENLGFKELTRLTQFMNYMMENHPEEIADVTFSYDYHYDEPCYSFGFSTIYATDQNVGFNAHNEIEELD